MLRLKKGIKESDSVVDMMKKYTHKELVRIALYAAEDCNSIAESNLAVKCIKTAKEWLENGRVKIDLKLLANRMYCERLRCRHSGTHEYRVNSARTSAGDLVNACATKATMLVDSCLTNSAAATEIYIKKIEEYRNYARFYSYENYPFKEKFNIDDDTELKIFLDFLEDNYPEALIYSREDFLNKRMCREYLRVLYQ